MKLIIDIPKGEYDKICKTMLHTSSGNPNFYFESKIANGTPLEQIRAEIEDFKEKCNASDYLGCGILDIIDKYTKGDTDV